MSSRPMSGDRLRWWIPVNVPHWLTPYDFPSAKALVLVGALTGVVYGAVTAPGWLGCEIPAAHS